MINAVVCNTTQHKIELQLQFIRSVLPFRRPTSTSQRTQFLSRSMKRPHPTICLLCSLFFCGKCGVACSSLELFPSCSWGFRFHLRPADCPLGSCALRTPVLQLHDTTEPKLPSTKPVPSVLYHTTENWQVRNMHDCLRISRFSCVTAPPPPPLDAKVIISAVRSESLKIFSDI